MHKMRRFLPPIPAIGPGEYDLYNLRVRLIALPRASLRVEGPFEEYMQPILESAARNACQDLVILDGYFVMPVHELQVHHIREMFPEAHIFPEELSVPSQAQQSIR